MRARIAFVAAIAALATVLVAPSPALAAPDGLACSAAGSYSKIIGGTPTTFWLIGTHSGYRYWHVVLPTSGGGETYSRSYVVRCSGTSIAWSADLVVTSTSGDRCGTTSTTQYQYVGSRTHTSGSGPIFFYRTYRYWHVRKYIAPFWVYDHSELARCGLII